MMENELIAIWQSSPNHERIKFEKSRLMLEVQSRLDSFNKAIKRRDWVEIGSAMIMIPVFMYQAYRVPNPLAKFGAICIAVWCLYVIYRLLKVKKTKPSETNSYLDYLKESMEYLEKQKNLLNKILYWYILPGLTGCTIMMIGMLDLFGKPWHSVVGNWVMWRSLLVFAAVGVFTYWINKRAVKKGFTPRLKKVGELIRLMEDDQVET